MTKKIEVLTDKIYQEGVEKAREEAEKIISQAREKAEAIEKEAENKAEQIISRAEEQAKTTRDQVEKEMKMAVEQSVSALKQEIADLITAKAVEPPSKELFSQKEYLGELIKTIVEKWGEKQSTDLDIILPEKDKEIMEKYFKNELVQQLNQEVTIKFSGKLKSGFKIAPSDSSYQINFTGQDFNNFFKAYLRPKTSEILFE